MRAHHRPFDPARNDSEKVCRFLQHDYVEKQECYLWHSSRLGDWMYGLWNEKKSIPSFFRYELA